MANANNSNGTACAVMWGKKAKWETSWPEVSLNLKTVNQSYSPKIKTPFCHKVEWLNKAKLVMFSQNTICCVDIELQLMKNHTEVNAPLLCKRLDMLKCNNGGNVRQHNLGLRSCNDELSRDTTTPQVSKEFFMFNRFFNILLSCDIWGWISALSNSKIWPV